MNNSFRTTSIITVLIALFALVGVTAAFAQGPNQPDDVTPLAMNQGRTEAGTGMGFRAVDEAAMHEAIAAALGISVEAYEAEVANGENAFTVAQRLGIDIAELQAAMDAVHDAAFQQAIDDGLVSQEQAEWILSHRGGESGQSEGMNSGQSDGSTGRMSRGAGSNGDQSGECLYPTP